MIRTSFLVTLFLDITVEMELLALDVYMTFQSFDGAIQQTSRLADTRLKVKKDIETCCFRNVRIRNIRWNLFLCSHLLRQQHWHY